MGGLWTHLTFLALAFGTVLLWAPQGLGCQWMARAHRAGSAILQQDAATRWEASSAKLICATNEPSVRIWAGKSLGLDLWQCLTLTQQEADMSLPEQQVVTTLS